jgi:hypothetical protein
MNQKQLKYIKEGNCWQLEETEIYFHLSFLQGCSDGYLKRIFKNDFQLKLDDESILKLRNNSLSTITLESIE